MTAKEKEYAIVYVIGLLAGLPDDHERVKLETVNPEWKGLTLVRHSGKECTNGSYALYCDRAFGKEKIYSRVITISEGWSLRHMTALIIGAIGMLGNEFDEEDSDK